jgi:hypothetical protein
MKSKEIKERLLHYLIYERSIPAITEGSFGQGICDVLAIKDQKFVMEYEIKVTKPDLDSELKTICHYYKNEECTKLYKDEKHRSLFHAFHTGQLLEDQLSMYSINLGKITRTVPNYFCFVVPKELAAYAVERLSGTPYGVISAGKIFASHTVDYGLYVQKKNVRIHENDVLSSAIYRFLFKGAEAHYSQLVNEKM